MSCNIAVYGAGIRAQPYLDALARCSNVRLIGICDPEQRAAEPVAAGWGARVYVSYDAMLDEIKPDQVWILVPPPMQDGAVQRAVEMSLPFFVDAPGCSDYARAKASAAKAAEKNLVTAVGFTARYADVIRDARAYVGNFPIPFALGSWLMQPADTLAATAASLWWNDACRLVDLLRLFCGDVSRVRALAPTNGPADSGLAVQLEFVSGGVGTVTCAMLAHPEPRIELELVGDGWSMSFAEGLRTLWLVERDRSTYLRCLNAPAAEAVTAFMEAIAAGDPTAVASHLTDALHTVAVCHAALLSAREGRPISLSEVTGTEPPAATDYPAADPAPGSK